MRTPPDRCRDVASALDTIRSLEELEGFVYALRSPRYASKPASEADWQRIAHKKVQLLREEQRNA